jgi:hypothetical protein
MDTIISFKPRGKKGQRTQERLDEILTKKAAEYSAEIERIRNLAEAEMLAGVNDGGSRRAKKALPILFPTGIISGHGRHSLKLERFSGLCCIDVDLKDNPGRAVEELKKALCSYAEVEYCALSCRGLGVYALFRVPKTAGTQRAYREYYFDISRRIKEDFGIVADTGCSSIFQGRYLSYDPNAYWGKEEKVWKLSPKGVAELAKENSRPERAEAPGAPCPDSSLYTKVEGIVARAERGAIDIAPTLRGWFIVGRALAHTFGERGRELFLRISNIWCAKNGRRQEIDPNKEYDYCLQPIPPGARPCTIASFFWAAREAGLLFKKKDGTQG